MKKGRSEKAEGQWNPVGCPTNDKDSQWTRKHFGLYFTLLSILCCLGLYSALGCAAIFLHHLQPSVKAFYTVSGLVLLEKARTKGLHNKEI